jgi:hypothetical protein
VGGRAQAALEPGAGHGQGVAARDGVDLIEGGRHGPGGVTQGLEVDTTFTVDEDLQLAAPEYHVHQVQATVLEQG